jgi:hypothetical protein
MNRKFIIWWSGVQRLGDIYSTSQANPLPSHYARTAQHCYGGAGVCSTQFTLSKGACHVHLQDAEYFQDESVVTQCIGCSVWVLLLHVLSFICKRSFPTVL